jgi:protein-tyrosine phosphatase
MIDIHCHLLPGIDDGPRNWEDAVELCRAMTDDGIRRAVATPHLIDGIYENVRSRVQPLVAELRQRCRDGGIDLDVLAGAEIDISSRFAGGATEDLPALGDGKAVLFEMPVAVVPHSMAEIIFSARARGFVPVLAHPERNELLQDDPAMAAAWVEAGAALQLDGDSLLGVWGRRTKRCGEELLIRGLLHAMASDAHSRDKRPPRLGRALERARELVGDDAVKLVVDGPELILAGQPPPTPLYRVTVDHPPSSDVGAVGRSRGFLGRVLGRLGGRVGE